MGRLRWASAILATGLLLINVPAAWAAPDPATCALQFLASGQASDGSVGGAPGVTADYIFGAAAAGFDPDDPREVRRQLGLRLPRGGHRRLADERGARGQGGPRGDRRQARPDRLRRARSPDGARRDVRFDDPRLRRRPDLHPVAGDPRPGGGGRCGPSPAGQRRDRADRGPGHRRLVGLPGRQGRRRWRRHELDGDRARGPRRRRDADVRRFDHERPDLPPRPAAERRRIPVQRRVRAAVQRPGLRCERDPGAARRR